MLARAAIVSIRDIHHGYYRGGISLPSVDEFGFAEIVRGLERLHADDLGSLPSSPRQADTAVHLPAPAAGSGAVLVSLADVVGEPVEWLWLHYIARAKVTILDGDRGLGKSTLALDLAARVSTGRPMPGSTTGGGPAGVVICSAEDGLADTIRPRLDAAGGDPRRFVALTGVRTPTGDRLPAVPGDLDALEEAATRVSAALIVIDPLMAYLDPTVNSHRDQDIRRALSPLAALADRTRAAVLVVRHLNKSAGMSAVYRGGGSIGIIGAARCALLAAPDPDDQSRCILAVSKSNLGPKPTALAYRLAGDPATDVARVVWEGATDHTAAALLATAGDARQTSARSDAVDWLRELLADRPRLAKDVERLARDVGISWRTVERAKSAAGVVSQRVGFGAESHFEWRIDRHRPPLSTLALNGGQWDPEVATDDG